MPHMMSSHTNIRSPMFFHPHEGIISEPSDENIEKATVGELSVDVPWLEEKQESDGPNSHPLTGSSLHYCLADVFHENNSKRTDKVLRQTKVVPQLVGKINTQTEEQLFSQTTKDDYFLNKMNSTKHLFFIRTIIDDMNLTKNTSMYNKISDRLQQPLMVSEDGRLAIIQCSENQLEHSIKPATIIDLVEKKRRPIVPSPNLSIVNTISRIGTFSQTIHFCSCCLCAIRQQSS